MASTGKTDPNPTQNGWVRQRWLAEKVKSGELPAAAGDILEKCDRVFIEDRGLDEHVALIAAIFADDQSATRPDAGAQVQELRAYLRRLLLVREMWARERC